ncbi:MAG: GerMN domain-containing protein [Candidatus Melainabacteria bacterium]|nr:GerMN domain-containing protein [Candidatus Melainabacteria bacterium]
MKNYFIFLFVSICFLFSFTSCSLVQESNNYGISNNLLFNVGLKDTKVCFTKSKSAKELYWVSVSRKIPKDDNIIEATLRELFLGPTKSEELKGIMTEIPTGTRLIKIEESEDEIVIDVSNQYTTGGGAATMQLRYLQVYKTLKKLAPQKKIYMLVEGKTLKAIGGEGLEVSQPLTKVTDYTEKYEKIEDLQP